MPPVAERIVSVRGRTVLAVLGIILAVLALLQLLSIARQVITWVLIAVFLAAALNPLVEFLRRRGIRRRGLAITLAYLLVFSVVFALGGTFVPLLADQVRQFVDAVPGFVEDLVEGRGRLGFLQERYQIVDRVEDAVGGDVGQLLGFSGTALSVTKSVITAVVAVITIVVLTFFMLLEGPNWIERFFGLLPEQSRPRWRRVANDVYRTVGGYVAGALLIAIIAGVTSSIVLTILGVSYAVAIGLVVAILDLVPLAGATIATILASTIAFLDQGLAVGLIALGWFILYQQIENHALYPLVYSRTVQLSPLVILIAVLVGASIAGILGALAAIPVAGTIQVLFLDWMRHRTAEAEAGEPVADAPL